MRKISRTRRPPKHPAPGHIHEPTDDPKKRKIKLRALENPQLKTRAELPPFSSPSFCEGFFYPFCDVRYGWLFGGVDEARRYSFANNAEHKIVEH